MEVLKDTNIDSFLLILLFLMSTQVGVGLGDSVLCGPTSHGLPCAHLSPCVESPSILGVLGGGGGSPSHGGPGSTCGPFGPGGSGGPTGGLGPVARVNSSLQSGSEDEDESVHMETELRLVQRDMVRVLQLPSLGETAGSSHRRSST